MAQELGRISRPSAEQYQGLRKLLLVPLVYYGPPAQAVEGVAALQNYWDQMQVQVASLEAALGGLHHVYHESLVFGGQEGLEHLSQIDQRSHLFVQSKCEAGAVLQPTEDAEGLAEALDLQRCLMMPFNSNKVALRIQEWFTESNRGRYEHIAQQIDSTLEENQVGLLLVSERHQIQFPSDIEVFYVSPPALDEFRRWFQNWLAQQQPQTWAAEAEVEDSEGAGEGPEQEETT
jgi:hypothetical protein